MTEMTAPLYRTVDDLDPTTASALLQFVLALADTKHRLGRRLSEWASGGAPALEAAVGAASMTQDELGHARSLYVILRDLPGAPPELGTETDLDRAVFFNPVVLDVSFPSWFDVIAALVLLDQALTVVIGATRESAFVPLQQRAGKILQEESFHRVFGESWLARLAGGETHARMQSAVERIWNVADYWFGPPDDSALATLLGAGILSSGPDALRSAWLARVTPLLQKNGLAIPDRVPAWERWDVARREVRDV